MFGLVNYSFWSSLWSYIDVFSGCTRFSVDENWSDVDDYVVKIDENFAENKDLFNPKQELVEKDDVVVKFVETLNLGSESCVDPFTKKINLDFDDKDGSSINRNSSNLDDFGVESEEDSFIELDPRTDRIISTLVGENSNSNESYKKYSTLAELMRRVDSSESCDEEEIEVENDVLLEHNKLIRKMKREMTRLKFSKLPTILEESMSRRIEDDPDERIRHRDRMDEIQIFYKKYLDNMHELDISNQQTMSAIRCLQLKNKKASLAKFFLADKLRKQETGHVKKLMKDLKRELELVYVEQVCMSWEILKWQYRKVEELQIHDPDGFRLYNQTAEEFHKFQQLLHWFTENEPYRHGPKVVSNILLVPLLKDEDFRNELKGDGKGAISISMLKEVIMSSMHSFSDFVRADHKDKVHAITLKGNHGVNVHLEDPSDNYLLTEIRSSLHKKQKRLKGLVTSGNCILRKFVKRQQQRLSPEIFLAQVELRLVSRVLNMSSLSTKQLLWCHDKMNKTNI